MDTIPLTSLNRLLLSTFLKNCTFCHNSRDKKGTFTFEEYQQIKNENVEIINDDSTYPFISYLSDLLAKSKPFDAAVKKLHDLIDQIAAATGHDSTDVSRALLVKLIEQPEEQQTFERLLETAEKFAAKHE